MNKKWLFTITMVLVSLLLVFLFTSCAQKSLVKVRPVKKAKIGEEFVVQKSTEKTPKWLSDPEFQVIKEKRQKFVVIKVDVAQNDRRAAERIAEGELRKRVAEGIKTLVESQFKEALSGTQESYSESFKSYVGTVASNIPVVGLIVTDTYWEKIQKVKSKDEVTYYYRVVKRAKMPYENYINARNKAWQDVLAQSQNESERKTLEKLVETMKKEEAE